jgi:hypothetical protein
VQSISAFIEGSLPENTASWQGKPLPAIKPVKLSEPTAAVLTRKGVFRKLNTGFVVAARPVNETESRRVKYWEIIADNLSKAGWSSLIVSI